MTRDRLHRLIERQHFRLAWWRTASDEVNWRRFFDISTLAGVRVERPEVFDAVHALVFRLYQEGVVDGLRIDHVDGLAEPREYCQRLRQRLTELRDSAPYVVVEKILGRGEPLRDDWPVDGTTGYDFMSDVGALLHDPAGAEPLARTWAELTGRSPRFADEALAARRKILAENLSAELDRAARALHRIARDSLTTRDFTFTTLRRVLTELVVHFPVYRIYPQNGLRSADRQHLFRAGFGGREGGVVARGSCRARSRECVARRQCRRNRRPREPARNRSSKVRAAGRRLTQARRDAPRRRCFRN